MAITRRQLGISAAALPLFTIGGRAEAATMRYRLATNLPLTHPLNIRMKQAIERIEKQSDGQLRIMLFPNGQLGSDTEMLSQIRSGAVQFFTLSGLILSTLVPKAAISGIGFAFKDYPQVWSAMDGKLGAYIRGRIAQHGLIAFEKIFDNGFRQTTTSTHPIREPADYHGLKIRVPVAALWTSLFKDFGAVPQSLNFNQVYSALQTHAVDAQENPLAVIETAKLYEVQKYCSMTNHMWDGFWFLANPAAFKKLPSHLQAVVEKEFNRAAVEERADVAKLNDSLRGKLTSQGMKVNDTEAAPFRAALQKAGFYAEWKKNFGDEAWSTLESAVGKLA